MNSLCRKLVCALLAFSCGWYLASAESVSANSKGIQISANSSDGTYMISASGQTNPVIHAGTAVKVDGKWFKTADYPKHTVEKAVVAGELGIADEWIIRLTGRVDAPDLAIRLRAYKNCEFGEMQVTAINDAKRTIHVEVLRVLDSTGAGTLNLGGPDVKDRVLSDSFSEDRPAIKIRDLSNAENGLHRGVGSQLVYNLQSKKSWFIGALTSDKFLSVLRLRIAHGENSGVIASYEVDSTGTTELLKDNSLQGSSAEDIMELSLPVAPGKQIASERMLFSICDNYHKQLETYGRLIRDLHHARVTAPTPLGWWSWTAYYFGINEGTAKTNALWLAEHLKPFGYNFFHIDEGYQFARGEYATPDATQFPHGVAALERKVAGAGLTPGIWTAPFEVSERSLLFALHPEWLIHNAKGAPIHIGKVADGKDNLYALDTTHPEAQEYLRKTYSTLVNEWGIRYFKLDFMEDSAIEGVYYQPNITALEAQRIGLNVIRKAVGEQVLLDKDGCELMNPVGIVDAGRISQDTGHTFSASKDAAPGIAARYFMNRNYFLADPDAFSVSKQTVDDQSWHGGSSPLTLDEAKVSIVLSAVSGGLFEIGDDLPALGETSERLALLENRDLLDMARLGKSSTPVDLMSYLSQDTQPSIFLLKENDRQSILTIFNWTDRPRAHHILFEELGLSAEQFYSVIEVFDAGTAKRSLSGAFDVSQPAHSVRTFKIMNEALPERAPLPKVTYPSDGKAGGTLVFSASPKLPEDAIVGYIWDFGDGVKMTGESVAHAYTHSGKYEVKVQATGLNGVVSESTSEVQITGAVPTKFHPDTSQRWSE